MIKLITLTVIYFALVSHSNIANAIYNPYSIDIDPMERLLLVNIENDPDTLYIGFEPQVFEDNINGTGHLIIGWRKDGRVDVFHQPTLSLHPEKYTIAGQGLANMIEIEMPDAFFEITERGVQAYYEFQDIHDRSIIIDIAENNPRKRKPFSLLAPMGDAVENPVSMPLIYVHDFYFVRRKKTAIYVSVDDKEHQPDRFPIPIDFSRMYFTRYSADPLIVVFNEAFSGELKLLTADANQTIIKDGELLIHLSLDEDSPAIKSLSRTHKDHTINIDFTPPFPNLGTVKNKVGIFSIKGDPSTGSIGGEYSLEKRDSETVITLIPSKGWKPVPTKLSLRLLYSVIKVFRRWPSTYQWTAVITEQEDNTLYINSSWQRINR